MCELPLDDLQLLSYFAPSLDEGHNLSPIPNSMDTGRQSLSNILTRPHQLARQSLSLIRIYSSGYSLIVGRLVVWRILFRHMSIPWIGTEKQDGQRIGMVSGAVEGVFDGIVDQHEGAYLVSDLRVQIRT